MALLAQVQELPEGLECVDAGLLDRLRSGAISRLPERALDCVPDDVKDRLPDDLVEFASTNPDLTLAGVVVGVVAVLGFVALLAKRAIKLALVFGVVAAVAWWWVAVA